VTAKLLVKEFLLVESKILKKYNSYVVAILDLIYTQLPKRKIEELFLNAVTQNFIAQVKYFIERQIDINLVHSKESKSALQLAAAEGHYYLCMLLLKQPNIIIARPTEWVNQTAYHLLKKAPQTKSDAMIYIELLRRLVTKDNVNVPNNFGETLVHEAAFRGNLTALNFLFELKANIAVRTKKSETPFHYALRAPKEVRALVFEMLMKEFKGSELGTFLKMRGPEGTCEMIASRYNMADIITLLSAMKEVTAKKWEDNLPRELFIEIFSYLSPKDLAVVALVCKSFFQIVTDPAFKTLKSAKESAETLIYGTSERYLQLAKEIFSNQNTQLLVTDNSAQRLSLYRTLTKIDSKEPLKPKKAISLRKVRLSELPTNQMEDVPLGYDHIFRILVFGKEQSGKKSLLVRFRDNKFPNSGDYLENTITKVIRIHSSQIKLQIMWQHKAEILSGMERPPFREVHLVLITFDLTNEGPLSLKVFACVKTNAMEWFSFISRLFASQE